MKKTIKIESPKIPLELESFSNIIEYIDENEIIEEKLVENIVIEDVKNNKVTINSCVFKNVIFKECDLKKIDLTDVLFENCDLSNVYFNSSGMYRVKFINCKLIGTRFSESVLKSVIFKECLGRYANFSFSSFKGVSISGDFSEAVFQEVQNDKLELDSVNLNYSIFSGTSLKNVDFTSSNIEGMEVNIKDLKGGVFTVPQALELTKLMEITIK